MAVDFQRRHFSVEEYHRMGEAGILGPDDRVELLRGEIVKKLTVGNRHRGCVNRLTQLLILAFAGRAIVQPQNPVVVLDDSEPEPDLALLEPNDAATGGRSATVADVFALIEVADSSRSRDTRFKRGLYAEAGIREYWVVDLIDRVVLVHRDADRDAQHYRTTVVARPGETIAFEAFPQERFDVAEIVGSA